LITLWSVAVSLSLNPRQDQLLKFVAQAEAQGHRPNIAQVMQELNLARESSATRVLEPLVRRGFNCGGRRRAWSASHSEADTTGHECVPLRIPFLGCITAGHCARRSEECTEWVDSLESLLPINPADFFLRVEANR
jgi:SOS-response transcriptional repressor LexA